MMFGSKDVRGRWHGRKKSAAVARKKIIPLPSFAKMQRDYGVRQYKRCLRAFLARERKGNKPADPRDYDEKLSCQGFESALDRFEEFLAGKLK